MRVTNVLAISGSLRAASINSAFLRAAARLAPPEISVRLLSGAGELPLFNPDLESQVPATVAAMRSAVARADALLIASPEYAHGVSGTIKNLLDWLVSYEPFVNKPVGVVNTSPRASHADAALRETLRTMSAALVEAACVTVPLLGAGLDETRFAQSPEVAQAARDVLLGLHRFVVQGTARSS
jgi:NAD(P)H-dependent FMN reductase